MNLFAILTNIGVPDILDICFITFVAYYLYKGFSGTKAFKALIGIVLLSGIYLLAETWGLFLTTWVFQILWQVFVILLIILFQKEIRQMLERLNPLKKIGYRQGNGSENWVDAFSEWVFDAARRKMGAIIVFERRELIFDLITKGVAVEGDPVPEILNSIFIKESPLHDGACLISNGKILKASCFLPLTGQENLPKKWGTRHRAALGLTEQSDACVLIISEERGEVSIALGQEIKKIENKDHLVRRITDLVLLSKESGHNHVMDKIKLRVIRRFGLKLAVFVFVFVLWLVLAGQQNFEKRVELPLMLKNIPPGLELSQPMDSTLSVTCRGLRKDVSLLTKNNITASLDLYSAQPGTRSYPITSGALNLPNGRINIVNIRPARIELTFEKTAKKTGVKKEPRT